jgi:hypothetical protein
MRETRPVLKALPPKISPFLQAALAKTSYTLVGNQLDLGWEISA